MTELYHSLTKLKVKIYRTKIGSAIMSHLFERYDDIVISIAPESYFFDRVRAVGYLLENKLILFQIIDDRSIFQESKIETFAKLEVVSKKRFHVFLQKAVFETTYENLIAIIQLTLDEILFISEGCSYEKAHELAMQAYISDSYKPINERKIKYPGKKVLKRLIIKYRGNVRMISEDPEANGVVKGTVSVWINNDLELQNLAIHQRFKSQTEVTINTAKSSRKKSRKKSTKTPSNPDREMLEALLINYEGNIRAMAENINIRTSVKKLQSWLKQEGLAYN